MKKQISTDQNKSNIEEVLRLLRETPAKLESLIKELSKQQLLTPLGPGERTPTEILAHLINCEAVTSESIYLALLRHEPLLAGLHAERDPGRLLRFDRLSFPELMAYFIIRRTVLLRILESLTEKQWSRVVQEEGKQRKESVYWRARALALHELEHLMDLENKLKKSS